MEQPIKILIVEDNVIIADDMQSMLEEIGYEIVDNVIVYEQAEEVLKTKQVLTWENTSGKIIIFLLFSSPPTQTGLPLRMQRR